MPPNACESLGHVADGDLMSSVVFQRGASPGGFPSLSEGASSRTTVPNELILRRKPMETACDIGWASRRPMQRMSLCPTPVVWPLKPFDLHILPCGPGDGLIHPLPTFSACALRASTCFRMATMCLPRSQGPGMLLSFSCGRCPRKPVTPRMAAVRRVAASTWLLGCLRKPKLPP